jgi:hypothetical protein
MRRKYLQGAPHNRWATVASQGVLVEVIQAPFPPHITTTVTLTGSCCDCKWSRSIIEGGPVHTGRSSCNPHSGQHTPHKPSATSPHDLSTCTARARRSNRMPTTNTWDWYGAWVAMHAWGERGGGACMRGAVSHWHSHGQPPELLRQCFWDEGQRGVLCVHNLIGGEVLGGVGVWVICVDIAVAGEGLRKRGGGGRGGVGVGVGRGSGGPGGRLGGWV